MANRDAKFMLKNSFTESAKAGTYSPPSPSPFDPNTNEEELEKPFFKSGTKKPHGMTHVNGVLVSRVDVPGCSNDDLKFWVDGSMIHFFASARPDPSRGFSGRKYGGTTLINPALYKPDEASGTISNGIFWLTIPMRDPTKGPKSGDGE